MFSSDKRIFIPKLHSYKRSDIYYFIDPLRPNWISTNERGAAILQMANNMPEEIAISYMKQFAVSLHTAWVHTCNFLSETAIADMTSHSMPDNSPYEGRERHLSASSLSEFWIHLNDACNLQCKHCLVNSAPGRSNGISYASLVKIIAQADKLGTKRYYITGGEPFLRSDIFDIARQILDLGAELIIMTNATLINREAVKKLAGCDVKRLHFQVSLDGSTAAINSRIRGTGFKEATYAIRLLSEAGFETSMASTVFEENLEDLANIPQLASKLGCKSVHLMWPHYRGRILSEGNLQIPSAERLHTCFKQAHNNAQEFGIILDNYESIKNKINRKTGIKFDLGNQCWESLCVYTDGHIYPSAAFAGVPGLDMGDTQDKAIERIWKESKIAVQLRAESILDSKSAKDDPFRFILGGQDIEQSYFYSKHTNDEGDFSGLDPTYTLNKDIAKDIMHELSTKRKMVLENIRGKSTPLLFFSMGENATLCGDSAWDETISVSTTHSNCVLSFDVERPHKIIQQFYTKAAEKPQANLCCPIKYDEDETSHIPASVLDRFYGCGSPILSADLQQGETVLDLGSGGGIDCFIASKKTKESGQVIGVDMTEQMLLVANENKVEVVKNLGYDNITFKKGFLEDIPADTESVDIITSNCVINLSMNKKQVFEESWRVLKDGGRFVVSDIVSDKTLPSHITVNKELWGECLSGSLTEQEFLQFLETTGFYGIELLSKSFWKEIEGYNFYSITVRAFKQKKSPRCNFQGSFAIYNGPFKTIVDEEGHSFNRHEPVEVCSDTANRLKRSPYRGCFTIVDEKEKNSCSPTPNDSKCC